MQAEAKDLHINVDDGVYEYTHKELAPYKLKPGRKIRIMFLMGLLTLHLSVDSCREYDHLFTDGGGWGEDHDFPILKTLRGIAMRLGELHNDEDVCILSSLDGKHIPLS